MLHRFLSKQKLVMYLRGECCYVKSTVVFVVVLTLSLILNKISKNLGIVKLSVLKTSGWNQIDQM